MTTRSWWLKTKLWTKHLSVNLAMYQLFMLTNCTSSLGGGQGEIVIFNILHVELVKIDDFFKRLGCKIAINSSKTTVAIVLNIYFNNKIIISHHHRGQKVRGGDTPIYDPTSGNPFSERPSTAHLNDASKTALEHAMADLDKDTNCPEGVELSVWHRMCTYRKQKVESENLVGTSQILSNVRP